MLALDKMLDGKTLPNGAVFTTGNLGFTQAQPRDVVSNTLLWGGEMRLTLDVFRDLGSAFIVALILIYLMLVGYYKSFALPLIVMGAIPLTLVGVFPRTLDHRPGVHRHFHDRRHRPGRDRGAQLPAADRLHPRLPPAGQPLDAVIEAGAVRFRPILLTALAIILGSAIMIT